MISHLIGLVTCLSFATVAMDSPPLLPEAQKETSNSLIDQLKTDNPYNKFHLKYHDQIIEWKIYDNIPQVKHTAKEQMDALKELMRRWRKASKFFDPFMTDKLSTTNSQLTKEQINHIFGSKIRLELAINQLIIKYNQKSFPKEVNEIEVSLELIFQKWEDFLKIKGSTDTFNPLAYYKNQIISKKLKTKQAYLNFNDPLPLQDNKYTIVLWIKNHKGSFSHHSLFAKGYPVDN